jgi:RNA polymerase sigma-70 factor (ECF subfamily)
MVIRLLGSRIEAEDVIQDTFTIALDRLGSLRQPDAVRAWFAQIAVSQVRRRLRRAKLLASLGLRDRTGTVDLESISAREADAETRSELAAVGRVLALLPTDERLAWMLRHVEGEPLERIARMCGCSLATVKRRIAAAETHVGRHFGTREAR